MADNMATSMKTVHSVSEQTLINSTQCSFKSHTHYLAWFSIWLFLFLPQQLGLALQAVEQLNLSVHVSDFILEVLPGDVDLLAELSEHTC